MLKNVAPLPHSDSMRRSFVQFIERKLGGRFYRDLEQMPYAHAELSETWGLVASLRKAGVIRNVERLRGFPDEPRSISWSAQCTTKHSEKGAGLSVWNERAALTAALAEALERYLWHEKEDYFLSPILATQAKIGADAIAPASFVGFSTWARNANQRLTLSDDTEYMWIRGHSWTRATSVRIPAQLVSAAYARRSKEPTIRMPITTGLATWETTEGAVLRGALETIERDAFMIMWLNQLSLPRTSWAEIRRFNSSLDTLLSRCAQYQLEPHLVRLISDAPTHAVCVVLVDRTSSAPRTTVGIKAGHSLAKNAEGALLEALRARKNARLQLANNESKSAPLAQDVGHADRLAYWSSPEKSERLAFLYNGPVENPKPQDWEGDTESEHLNRIVSWCRESRYEIVSVDLGRSKANPTGWKVQMVVMPDMQPMHLREQYQYSDGVRLKEIPKMYGYMPRETSFTSEPHPFV